MKYIFGNNCICNKNGARRQATSCVKTAMAPEAVFATTAKHCFGTGFADADTPL